MRDELTLIAGPHPYLSDHFWPSGFSGVGTEQIRTDAIDTALREAYEEIGLPRVGVLRCWARCQSTSPPGQPTSHQW
jgi:8-oxo-dGTP pyrophosphatase MutT (NUDIX family)